MRPSFVRVEDMDINTGRRDFPSIETLRAERAEIRSRPFFSRIYAYLC